MEMQPKKTPLKIAQDRLYSELRNAKREHAGHLYIPLGDVERILHISVLTRLIQHSGPRENEDGEKAAQLILQRHPKSDLTGYRFLRSFATLISCGNYRYTERAIRYFLHCSSGLQVAKVWKPPEDSVTEAHYVNDSSLRKAFYENWDGEVEVFYHRFFERKRFFCAKVLKEGRKHNVREDVVLPFSIDESKVLGKGAAGRVYKVELGSRQWVYKRLSNPEDILLAVKKFNPPPKGEGKDHFINEFSNLTKLMNATIKSQNVMLPRASLIHGEARYLIYDLAETSMDKFIWDPEPFRDLNFDKVRGILKNAADLVGALYWIHEYGPYSAMIHGDIRPENILILREGSRETWKLADFDRAVARSTSSNESGAAMKQSGQPYHPPEAQSGRRNDVWSMGCMIMLLLSWLHNGPTAIGHFLSKRNRDDPTILDVFYDIDYPKAPDILSAGVREWIEKLRNEATTRIMFKDTSIPSVQVEGLGSYSTYVKEVTKYISDNVFVPIKIRDQAQPFYEMMERSYSKMYPEDWMETQSSDENEAPPYSPTISEVSLPSELPTRPQSRSLSPEYYTSSRGVEYQDHRIYNGDRLAVPERLKVALALPQREALSPILVPGLRSTPLLPACTKLCSAISREPPPPEISAYAQYINITCPKCDDVPIHKAIRRGSKEWIVKLLQIKDIDLEKECSLEGTYTPLKRCCVQDRPWAAKLLLQAHCQLNIDRSFIASIRSYDTQRKIKKYVREEKDRRRRH